MDHDHSMSPKLTTTNSRPQTKATREDWLHIARETLIQQGIDQVKIKLLGEKLNVSRASFYWYFDSRQALVDELLKHWAQLNTNYLIEQAALPAASITEGVINIAVCWFDKTGFNPHLDAAVRAWGRSDLAIYQRVQQEDGKRIKAIRQLFLNHGYEDEDAFIRARVIYFTQIGYYALDLKESNRTRLSYLVPYLRTFTGVQPSSAELEHAQQLLYQFMD